MQTPTTVSVRGLRSGRDNSEKPKRKNWGQVHDSKSSILPQNPQRRRNRRGWGDLKGLEIERCYLMRFNGKLRCGARASSEGDWAKVKGQLVLIDRVEARRGGEKSRKKERQ